MNDLLQSVLHTLARLAPRERRLLQVAVAATVLVLLYFLVGMIQDGKSDLVRRIASKERELEEVQLLRRDYLRLKGQVEAEVSESTLPQDFSESSFLIGIVKRTVSNDVLDGLDSSSRDLGEDVIERSVEMKLKGVTLGDLVNILHQIHNAPTPLTVAQLKMKKQLRDPYRFDITVVVTRRSSG